MGRFERVALGATMVVGLAMAVPGSAAVEVEGLPNGSLEGVGQPALGWQIAYNGAEKTSEHHSGIQSVNLAKIGASRGEYPALGLVIGYPPLPLSTGVHLPKDLGGDYRGAAVPTVALFDAVKSFSFWYKVPLDPTRPIALQPFIYIQKPNPELGLSQYACLVSAAGPPLAETDGWQQVVLDGSHTYNVGGAYCPGGPVTGTLESIQASGVFDGYTVYAVFLQTVISSETWVGGTPVYVDDLSLTLDL